MKIRLYIIIVSVVFLVNAFLILFLPSLGAAVCGSDAVMPDGGLLWPAEGEIVGTWSLDCIDDKGHRGIDIAIAAGSDIRATAAGNIVFTGYTPAEGGGTTVAIEHPNGLRSTYLHLGNALVSTGDEVIQGQILGVSDGRPLHFGLKSSEQSGVYYNPLDYLPSIEDLAGNPGADDKVPQGQASQSLPLPAVAVIPPPDTGSGQLLPGTEAAMVPAETIDISLAAHPSGMPLVSPDKTPQLQTDEADVHEAALAVIPQPETASIDVTESLVDIPPEEATMSGVSQNVLPGDSISSGATGLSAFPQEPAAGTQPLSEAIGSVDGETTTNEDLATALASWDETFAGIKVNMAAIDHVRRDIKRKEPVKVATTGLASLLIAVVLCAAGRKGSGSRLLYEPEIAAGHS